MKYIAAIAERLSFSPSPQADSSAIGSAPQINDTPAGRVPTGRVDTSGNLLSMIESQAAVVDAQNRMIRSMQQSQRDQDRNQNWDNVVERSRNALRLPPSQGHE